MKRHEQTRIMLEEISDVHIEEAADILSGDAQLPQRETGAHRKSAWIWTALAAVGIVAVLGAATVRLNKNAQRVQSGSENVTADEAQQTAASEEEQTETVFSLIERSDVSSDEGVHITVSSEVANAVIVRDALDLEGQEGQIWYAAQEDCFYAGLQSGERGLWCWYQRKSYEPTSYMYFIKNTDGLLYELECWVFYEDGKAEIRLSYREHNATTAYAMQSSDIEFRYGTADLGDAALNEKYPLVSAEELYAFLEPVYAYLEGADLVFTWDGTGICPAQEQPDLSDGYEQLALLLPMVSEEYYNEALAQYQTLPEQLSALLEAWYAE